MFKGIRSFTSYNLYQLKNKLFDVFVESTVKYVTRVTSSFLYAVKKNRQPDTHSIRKCSFFVLVISVL